MTLTVKFGSIVLTLRSPRYYLQIILLWVVSPPITYPLWETWKHRNIQSRWHNSPKGDTSYVFGEFLSSV